MNSRTLYLALIMTLAANVVVAQPYDPGASDTEIKLGQTAPYSGPVSAVGTVGFASTAFLWLARRSLGRAPPDRL